VQRNPTNAAYPAGVVVTITANPNAGWYFANWSGDTNSPLNPLNVPMLSNMVITGNFLPYPTYSLQLATNGQGSIVLSPLNNGYLSNTLITATASAAAGWVFTGWSGVVNGGADPVSFPVNTNVTLQGNFAQLPTLALQPVSQTNRVGGAASFAVDALGATPLNYQWYFSGGGVSAVSTNATLALSNVQTTQAGNYWVVATNHYGSVTSQVASLVLTNSVGPTNWINTLDEGGLLAAVAVGGWVGVQVNGTILLTNTVTITNNVVLDGTGYGATISGGNAVQLFYVAAGASLTLSNLTLANGNSVVTSGPPDTPADGGAIYVDGGMAMVSGCTLSNNMAQSVVSSGLARGGAIFNNGGTVWLSQSVLISNSVDGGVYPGNSGQRPAPGLAEGFGGALYATNGTTTLTGCTVNGNTALNVCSYAGTGLTMGGALYQASGVMTLSNCNFIGNLAIGGRGGWSGSGYWFGSPADGGAVAIAGGSVAVALSQFVNNQADGAQGYWSSPFAAGGGAPANGGAVYCTGICLASDSTFAENIALAGNYAYGGTPGSGGGVYNAGIFTFNRCSVYRNTAQGGSGYASGTTSGGNALGGGVCNEGQLAVTNCTIADNSANGAAVGGGAFGGGVYNDTNATSVLMNLTIAQNNCSSPSETSSSTNVLAAGSQIANNYGLLRLHNTLLAYGTNSNAFGPITDDGYNICSDGSANLFSGSSYNYTDPQLTPLGNYGGPTLCMGLLPTSPAIDNGDSDGCPNTDQRGYPRPFGSGPDIGAFEFGSAISTIPYPTLGLSGTNLVVSFSAFPTNTYYLQFSADLATWITVSTNGPFTSEAYVNLTVGRQSVLRGFFRLLQK
jgi:hypothetical protein